MAKLNKSFNLEELVAYEHAYGGKLTRTRQIQLIGFPVIMLGVFGFILTQSLLVSFIMATAGVIAGYLWLLPRQVRENYFEASYVQRNSLINQLSQSMLDESRTYDRALILARDSIEGETDEASPDYNELKADLNVLIGQLMRRPGPSEIKRAFRDFESAYAYDDLFVLFFEQIETKVLEGYINEAVLEELMKQHNSLYEEQTRYNAGLASKQREFRLISIIMAGVLWFTASQVMSALGKTVRDAYFKSPLGWTIASIFGVAYILLMFYFYQKYFDRNLMSLTASRDKLVKVFEIRPYDDKQAEEINQFRNRPVNKLVMRLLSEREHKMFQKLNLSIVDEINFQRKRVLRSIAGFFIGFVLIDVFKTYWSWSLPLVLGLGLFYLSHRKLKTLVDGWTLNREVAFAKFMRLLTPYLLSGTNLNAYRLFEQIGSRLNSDDDRRMVSYLLESLRLNPGKEEPYTDFARAYSGNPRAVTRMSSIYGILNTRGSKAVIETLARQADEEFMEQVRKIAKRKINSLGVISTLTFMVGMLPLFGMLASLLFLTIKPLFDGGLGF
jgi:hypothetical protein